ncbi:MAG: sel1 repeat family protein [Paludibacteraceae bacterium]|nr:sel1 repeat family protein [Paludibacteraceae bacterium]
MATKSELNALFQLAQDYHYAKHGKPHDIAEAMRLYREAAQQGHAEAQEELGYCYEFGRGVAIDIEEAEKWYQLSNQGDEDANEDKPTTKKQSKKQSEPKPIDLAQVIAEMERERKDNRKAKITIWIAVIGTIAIILGGVAMDISAWIVGAIIAFFVLGVVLIGFKKKL